MPNVGYREIADQVRSAIESGDLPPGAALPSESELSAEHGVARTTARRALIFLEDSGLVEAAMGRGRFVRSTTGSERRLVARFEKVARTLRGEIENKTLVAGQHVGTEAALAERFSVSQGTVRRALQQLADEGVVTAISGRGWFVGNVDDPPTRTARTASAIRSAILSGEWPAGARIPGEVTLARKYGVGRITVRRAFAALEAEGLLGKQSGRGRLVLGDGSD